MYQDMVLGILNLSKYYFAAFIIVMTVFALDHIINRRRG